MKDGRIIGEGYHEKYGELHAERNAIKHLKESAEGATIYVTLEPCPMCAGAIIQARIPKVVIGSMNPKAGCAGSVINLLQMEGFNHQTEIVNNVLQPECSSILQNFFQKLRKEK